MKSLKVLVLGVLLPGAFSAVVYGAMNDDDGRVVRVERGMVVDVDEIVESVEAELAQVEAGLEAHPDIESCAHAVTEESRLDADEVEALVVDAGAGALVVTGRDGADEIVVRSTYCASDEDFLRDLRTTLADAGDRAVVKTEYPRRLGFGRSYARIDLTIELPLGMPTQIEDGSGEIVVVGTGETSISDGSGELQVRSTTGDLVVQDGSGEMELRDIGGDVEIVDGSGEIRLAAVEGSVTVTDGSGSIEARDVLGSVDVRADGSGGIDVMDVGGDFIVRADGSGDISHSGVEGQVRVPRKR